MQPRCDLESELLARVILPSYQQVENGTTLGYPRVARPIQAQPPKTPNKDTITPHTYQQAEHGTTSRPRPGRMIREDRNNDQPSEMPIPHPKYAPTSHLPIAKIATCSMGPVESDSSIPSYCKTAHSPPIPIPDPSAGRPHEAPPPHPSIDSATITGRSSRPLPTGERGSSTSFNVGKARQGKARQGKARQGKARQEPKQHHHHQHSEKRVRFDLPREADYQQFDGIRRDRTRLRGLGKVY
ncbi:hypothetical protein CHU98_g11564 [Xylaria longipes]|nr:hypothetical protein CHU98_g11564 [Xylaria longipes]